MTPEEEARLLALMAAEDVEPLRDFILRVAPHHPPQPHMDVVLDLIERTRTEEVRATISMPPGHSKLLSDSTYLETPNGPTTHGELKVGSVVYAPDGSPTTVTYVSPRQMATHQITFSDGESFKVNLGHRWRVFVRGAGYRTLETKDMIGKLFSGTCRNGEPRARFLVDYCQPLQGEYQELPFEPYFLGLWLGDGSKDASAIFCSASDEVEYKKILAARGHKFGHRNVHADTSVVRFGVVSQGSKGTGVIGYFRGKKHIPEVYQLAGLEQRRDLLRGLIDSEGHVDPERGRVRFVNTNPDLIDGVERMARSLGYRTTTTSQEPVASGDIHSKLRCYTVQWTPHDGEQQALLPRKDHRRITTRRRRSIISIEPCVAEPGHCITVDHPSHCYLIGKTLVPTHNSTCMINGLAWRICVDPNLEHAFVSHGISLPRMASGKVQDMIIENGMQFTGSRDDWTTPNGNSFMARGIMGGITGRRVSGLCVVDDVTKNAEQATSLVYREKIWSEFLQSVFSRLKKGSSILCISTRWHPDDLIGRIHADEANGEWEEVNVPAVRDANGDACGFDHPEATALWPEEYPLNKLYEIYRQVGDYVWSAMYQGQPVPPGANVFNDNPARFNLDKYEMEPGTRLVIGVDPAASPSTKADHSVAVVMAAKGGGERTQAWILDVVRGQWTIPELCRQLRAVQARWKCPLAIEAVSGFKAVPQLLKDTDPNLRLLPVELKGNKFIRCQPFAAAWNDGRVHVPIDAPWVTKYINELASFTGVADLVDDQVDASAHAYAALYRSSGETRRGQRVLDFLPLG